MNMSVEQQAALPWNKGKLVGQKAPLRLKDIWTIRIRLQLANDVRNLALFNLAIDSKLRGCDLVRLKVSDVARDKLMLARASVVQRKTLRPVQFEITLQTREAIAAWLATKPVNPGDYLFSSRLQSSTCRRGSMPASSRPGLVRLALMRWRTELTQCGEQKRR